MARMPLSHQSIHEMVNKAATRADVTVDKCEFDVNTMMLTVTSEHGTVYLVDDITWWFVDDTELIQQRLNRTMTSIWTVSKE